MSLSRGHTSISLPGPMFMKPGARTSITSQQQSVFFFDMAANSNSQPVHVAITRRIKPGCEQEFQAALKDFFAKSLARSGVQGAAVLVPPPGSSSMEYGILRSF